MDGFFKTDIAALSRCTTALALCVSLIYALSVVDCAVAAGTCGNGSLESPEQCDDGDTSFHAGDYCSASCTTVPCGIPTDPEATKPKAVDALFTLRAAVGQVTCDMRVCDVNRSDTVTATDALTILKAAVGLPVELTCTPSSTTTTTPAPGTTIPDTTTTTQATTSSTTITPTTSTSTSTTYAPPVCGATEICGSHENVALDENCNGEVDEIPNCTCVPGLVQGCFEGDPSYFGTPGCYPGVQRCGESGTWGPCVGGVQATDACFTTDYTACHAITADPLATVSLKDGVGDFGADALSESWTVACPQGATSCPPVSGLDPPDDFQPIESGEHTVIYEKVTAGGPQNCSYPLIVGMRGLRVELEWEHDLGANGVDLDLHVHEPGTLDPWGGDVGNPHDCGWDNCTAAYCATETCPEWFSGVMPPDPVSWSLSPTPSENSCYFAPGGRGFTWQSLGLGCHNPRLELDTITCDSAVTEVNDSAFCLPENINIDVPPKGEWTRIGVHYYSNHGLTYEVHPRIRIFCNGILAADLGPAGYNVPETPVSFPASDGSTLYWLVADVMFHQQGKRDACVVQPLYADPGNRTPLLTTVTAVQSSFGPPYPAASN